MNQKSEFVIFEVFCVPLGFTCIWPKRGLNPGPEYPKNRVKKWFFAHRSVPMSELDDFCFAPKCFELYLFKKVTLCPLAPTIF